MTYNTYPIRRRIIAIGALAGVTATGSACTSESIHASKQSASQTSITSAPMRKPSKTASEVAPNAELGQTETRFQMASIKAGMQLAEDATNPKSLCETISPTSIGNPKGPADKPGFPGMLLTFDPKKRQVHMTAITDLNPSGSSKDHHVVEVQMVFAERGPEPSILDRSVAAGKSLTPQDYLTFFSAGNLGATSVDVTDGDFYGKMELVGPNYMYDNYTTGEAEQITGHNDNLMSAFTERVDHVSATLHQGIS